MEYKDAINYLKYPIGRSINDHEEAVKIAVSAIEKQIVKLVRPTTQTALCDCGICPNCLKEIEYRYSKNICEYCGQYLIWED